MKFFKKFKRKSQNDETLAEKEENDAIIDEDKTYSLDDSEDICYVPINRKKSVSKFIGEPTQIDTLAPASVAIDNDDNPDTIAINEVGATRMFTQPYYVPSAGYPYQVDTNTFLGILNHGWVDMTLDIYPKDNALATRDLKRIQTVIESNLIYQQEKGMQFQLRDNVIKSQSIDAMLNGIQTQTNSLFYLITTFLISGSNANDLRRHCDQFTKEMSNLGFTVQKLVGRVKSGLLTTIPLGVDLNNLDDAMRMMDCYALAKMDLAQNETGVFHGGIPFAVNMQNAQRNIIYLNTFGTDDFEPDNYNMGIVGESGTGKSFAVKVKIAREVAIENYYVRTIDPQREYVKLAHYLGSKDALNLDFNADSNLVINPCRLSIAEMPANVLADYKNNDSHTAEDDLDEFIRNKKYKLIKRNGEHFIRYVPIQSKINQIIDFVRQIYSSDYQNQYVLSPVEHNILEQSIRKVFQQQGITSDPNSLYTNKIGKFNGKIVENLPKPEPTLSNIVAVIRQDYYDNDKENSPAKRLLSVLAPYLRDGSIPIFDGQTFFGNQRSTDLSEYHYVNFNISDLTGSFKQVASYVIAQINWNNWILNPLFAKQKKELVIDEILQLIKSKIFGDFAENAVRQARKFNASFVWIAQDLGQIQNSDQFRALISNSYYFFFLHIKEAERKNIQNMFNLNDGEMDRLCSHTEQGEGLLVQDEDKMWVKTLVMEHDMEFAQSNVAKDVVAQDEWQAKQKIDRQIRQDRHIHQ